MHRVFIVQYRPWEALRSQDSVVEALKTAYSLREKDQSRQLQQALGDLKQDVRRDSREPHDAVALFIQLHGFIEQREIEVTKISPDLPLL